MKNWLKVGLTSAFIVFLISLFVFSSLSFNVFYKLMGKPVLGIRIFYALVFINISFFAGIIVGAVTEKCRDKLDYYSKIFVIWFNGIAFFLVLGFGFSLQVWKATLNNNLTWLSILAFFLAGLIIMFFVFLLTRRKLKLKTKKIKKNKI